MEPDFRLFPDRWIRWKASNIRKNNPFLKRKRREPFELALESWRQLCGQVVLSNGEVRQTRPGAGYVILLIEVICQRLGRDYVIEEFDWPKKGDHVCIRTDLPSLHCVTDADCGGDLDIAEAVAQTIAKRFQLSWD